MYLGLTILRQHHIGFHLRNNYNQHSHLRESPRDSRREECHLLLSTDHSNGRAKWLDFIYALHAMVERPERLEEAVS